VVVQVAQEHMVDKELADQEQLDKAMPVEVLTTVTDLAVVVVAVVEQEPWELLLQETQVPQPELEALAHKLILTAVAYTGQVVVVEANGLLPQLVLAD
jgi:hypothetical protein